MLFISHDLAVVRTISDAVLVLEGGHVREANATEPVFTAPTATYTRALLDAIPDLRPDDYPTEAAHRVDETSGSLVRMPASEAVDARAGRAARCRSHHRRRQPRRRARGRRRAGRAPEPWPAPDSALLRERRPARATI